MAAFARAMLVIPKTLAVNGAHDATELVSKLRAYHNAAQTKKDKKSYMYTGLDLDEGKCRNNLNAGVLEPAMSKVGGMEGRTGSKQKRHRETTRKKHTNKHKKKGKEKRTNERIQNKTKQKHTQKQVKMIRFATEAAVTLLRIDDAINMTPKQDPSGPQGNGY